MTIEDLVSYIRLSVRVQDPEGSSKDSAYLIMTDEEIMLYIKIATSTNFPDLDISENVPNEMVYPIVLLTKKDLYYTLATIDAPLFDLGADNNNYLKRSQRFDHYMKLVYQVDSEYRDFIEDGGVGGNTINTYNVYLSKRYNTRYNYEGGVSPTPLLFIRNVGENFVEFDWKCTFSRFCKYSIYLGEKELIDKHLDTVIDKNTLFKTIFDIHKNKCRITGLDSETTYHVAVGATEMNTLTGYAEKEFTTLPASKIPLERC